MLLLYGAPGLANAATIEKFLDGVKGLRCQVKHVLFGLDPGRAMLIFDGEPGQHSLQSDDYICIIFDTCAAYWLQGNNNKNCSAYNYSAIIASGENPGYL
jgi:hypothetical protein